jgi:hypothetical protein
LEARFRLRYLCVEYGRTGHFRAKWKLAFGQALLKLFFAGAETLSLIEILGFAGSNDFRTVANASQPAGDSDKERSTSIPFT